jgi:hypothetical protein
MSTRVVFLSPRLRKAVYIYDSMMENMSDQFRHLIFALARAVTADAAASAV